MKTSKSSMKPHKVSPIRKGSIVKKSRHSRSPMRVIGSSRPSKHLPGMKSLPKRNASPVRMRRISISPARRTMSDRSANPVSPISIDRARSIKDHKYEKRKLPSPIMHSSRSVQEHRRLPSYPEKYSRSPSGHVPHYAPSVKKSRRDQDRFRSPSPMHQQSAPSHTESHSSHRSESVSHGVSMPSIMSHHRREEHAYDIHPRTHSSASDSKEVSIKSYDDVKRYRNEREHYASPDEKSYAPTLHERFSSCVDTSRNEPRIRYSTQDLEKITIDIHRNLRDQHSPTLRRIMNPSDVKLVRRVDEGHRPIFDREEIKQAPRDLREDAYFERKMMSGGTLYSSSHSMDLREVENYEITRHRFDAHHTMFSSASGRSLSDRWQNPEGRKDVSSLDRVERDLEYERISGARHFSQSDSRSLSDPDYRPDRYAGDVESRSRSGYQNTRHHAEPRDVIPVSRKESLSHESRSRLPIRRDGPPIDDARPVYHSERRYSTSKGPDSPKWHSKSRSRSREKLPDFSRRPDKYSYRPSWEEKPEMTPRGSSYFEHDNRESSESFRGRNNPRIFRSPRGFRARGSRPPSRGDLRFRGSFRGYRGGGSSRGRSSSRRGRFSPGMWEHDLYSRSLQDRKAIT